MKHVRNSALNPSVVTIIPEITAANAPAISSTESNMPMSIPREGLSLTDAINASSAGR